MRHKFSFFRDCSRGQKLFLLTVSTATLKKRFKNTHKLHEVKEKKQQREMHINCLSKGNYYNFIIAQKREFYYFIIATRRKKHTKNNMRKKWIYLCNKHYKGTTKRHDMDVLFLDSLFVLSKKNLLSHIFELVNSTLSISGTNLTQRFILIPTGPFIFHM